MRKTITGAALAAMVLTALAAQAAPTLADKCEASKNKTAGAYYSCREKAEASAISKGLPADYSKCTAKFDDKWDGAETKGEGMCPDTVTLTADMNAFIAAQAADAALVVAGAPIPDCAGDLATCEAQPTGRERETGQTLCYDNFGTGISCAGTGQDGEFLKGVVNSFTDNGNGTVTDNQTGLMWEKLSDNGDIHDQDTTYDWTTAVTTKIAALNSASFGGHNDWRLPNRKELESLLNIGAVNPATFSEFHSGCMANCTVLTCSCTPLTVYWSSSTYQLVPLNAWVVNFSDGDTSANLKFNSRSVRAVRAGV